MVYDEFNRSRPEANNVLLGVLEERLLILPTTSRDKSYVKVHPKFRSIFTSNPAEYAGVHQVQDALGDRMVTLDLDHYDRDTEIAITSARSGLSLDDAERIVDIVRDFRATGEYTDTPTLRSSIMIARVVANRLAESIAWDRQCFMTTCLDVLGSKIHSSIERRESQKSMLVGLIELRRIPPSSDVLHSYEALLDEDGELLSYQRVRSYTRGETMELEPAGEKHGV